MRLLLFFAFCVAAHAAGCEGLKSLALPHTSIDVAESVPAGKFKPDEGPAVDVTAAFCRVAGSLKPTADSDIRFEVWMPASGWTGKMEGVGNGGFAGSISYPGLARLVGAGYAAAATDTGHKGSAVDAQWALHHPEKIVDFGHRAIHETAVTGRAIIAAFYGSQPKRTYSNSCSDGGREALMEAQRYPGDYDGIIAGAPANFWTHLVTAGVWDTQAVDGDGWIPPAKIPAVESAMLSACDAQDGVKDGVIGDPARCRFDPQTMLCHGTDSDTCLTAAQAQAVKKILDGPVTSKGARIFPGKSPGGVAGRGGWADWVIGQTPGRSLGAMYSTGFYSDMVFDDPKWDFRKFDFDRDPQVADKKVAAALNATDPDLSKFRQRGGKLILYHGWSDPAISAQNTVDYYNNVVRKMGNATGEFVRLFMAPGMQHCGGGPGPNDFGQAGAPTADPDHDINAALERWVEQGKAPERIVAKRREDGRTRPLCAYPMVAQWNGTGSIDDAGSFVCGIEKH